jgi:hypothetical protein
MTLQNFGQPLLLVAASACKCGGCMTLQKSAFRWLHEAANWQGSHPERPHGEQIGPVPVAPGAF